MKWLKFLISLFITLGFCYLLNTPFGVMPPLGKFLNPFAGFWQNGHAYAQPPEQLNLPGITDTVTVAWDDRGVPHIFARNDADLYFAQGYITARDRLWQMEFQTHAAAGRLSEVAGEQTLKLDRFRRRSGMIYAAEQALAVIMADTLSRAAVESYTAGVNALIASLDYQSLPLEYKILNYRPEPWTPLKTSLLLKYMAWNLTSYYNRDWAMTDIRAALGDSLTDLLFPLEPPFNDPIVPAGTKWNFDPIKLETSLSAISIERDSTSVMYNEQAGLGSNNWALSGAKTASGKPILCNDPHLGLSLPSIWYELQLTSPGCNVYGVSIPGAPAVVIGFNSAIAWGLTNAGSDVLDLYKMSFKDDSKSQYRFGDDWLTVQRRVEEIKVRGAEVVVDTVLYTIHGPILTGNQSVFESSLAPADVALRWTGHDPSNELLAYVMLNRASDYHEFHEAISHYACPAMNFAYADTAGTIAIYHNGKLPLRRLKQGRYILDGSDPQQQWQGFIPRDQLPHLVNPVRGYVSSANQKPVDSGFPYYLGWNFEKFERGARINELLEDMERITPEEMIAMQTDALNMRARLLLPSLLHYLEGMELSSLERECRDELASWDYHVNSEKMAPLIFKRWLSELRTAIWSDDLQKIVAHRLIPDKAVTIDLLLNHPQSDFLDDRSTTKKETIVELVNSAFRQTCGELKRERGDFGEAWQWGDVHRTNIGHLARIPALSRSGLRTDGDWGIINATTERIGPSWRMVVELGQEVRGWGIYPGGQSGNPGSAHYDNAVDDWVRGEMYELLFLVSEQDSIDRVKNKTTMVGE